MISNITQEELDSIVSLTELEDVVDALLEEEQEQYDYWAELEHDYYDHDDAWQAAQDDWERNYNGGS